jgi:hypothetical protein
MFLAAPALACGGNPVCTVKDPTGTPLNIRAAPAGRIIGSAKNGTRLEFIDHQMVGGQRWARVGRYEPSATVLEMDGGVVFANYLRCERPLGAARPDNMVLCTVADPTGTPLNIRAAPNGAIVGTLRNGTRLRVTGLDAQSGRPRAQVTRLPADNAICWVFDAYMKCQED